MGGVTPREKKEEQKSVSSDEVDIDNLGVSDEEEEKVADEEEEEVDKISSIMQNVRIPMG